MNALLAKCVELRASIGIQLLVYGRFVYGRKGEDSLTAFKSHNGFKTLELRRYYVPLSLRGKIGLRLSRHRRLNEMIPGPVLRLLLKLRSKWYEDRDKNELDENLVAQLALIKQRDLR